MTAKLLSTTVVLALISSVALVAAWGPASHYYFTCTASNIPLNECLTKHTHLLSGTEMPDAFFFVNFLSPLTAAPVACQGWDLSSLHSPILAGYLYRMAPQFTTSTFNALEFAVGFGMHVSADAAGFYTGGYLGTGWGIQGYQPLPAGANTMNWMALWPFMEAVDSYVFSTYFNATGTHLPLRGVPDNGEETAAFVAAVVQQAIADGAAFPNVTAATVQQCAAAWQSIIAEESLKIEASPAAMFEFLMTFNDRHKATNFSQALANFDAVRGCAVGVSRAWLDAITNTSLTPYTAAETAYEYLATQYAAGNCTSLSSRRSTGPNLEF